MVARGYLAGVLGLFEHINQSPSFERRPCWAMLTGHGGCGIENRDMLAVRWVPEWRVEERKMLVRKWSLCAPKRRHSQRSRSTVPSADHIDTPVKNHCSAALLAFFTHIKVRPGGTFPRETTRCPRAPSAGPASPIDVLVTCLRITYSATTTYAVWMGTGVGSFLFGVAAVEVQFGVVTHVGEVAVGKGEQGRRISLIWVESPWNDICLGC